MEAETPVARAIRIASGKAGGLTALGVAVGVSGKAPPGAIVWAWVDRGRVPPEYCKQVQAIGGEGCELWDMRPEDWHRIWPELIGAAGAPAIEAKAA